MFLLFINDIHENLDSILRLFADDAILYRSIKTMNDSDILQNDIDKLVSWSKTWQMQFNVTKCHTIRISRKKVNGHLHRTAFDRAPVAQLVEHGLSRGRL